MPDAKATQRLGIMGGTFDPVHNGHLFAASEAREVLDLERVLFVPSGTPPHKHYPGMATAEQRYEMTLLATAHNEYFDISRVETDREGKSYTLETLLELRKEYPAAEMYFITGVDAILDLPQWYRPEEITRVARLVVVSRPGYAHDKIRVLPDLLRERISIIDTARLDISGTDIRERTASGKSIDYMMPEPVARYIKKHNLYSRSDGESF